MVFHDFSDSYLDSVKADRCDENREMVSICLDSFILIWNDLFSLWPQSIRLNETATNGRRRVM
jgi:hypothetical protein